MESQLEKLSPFHRIQKANPSEQSIDELKSLLLEAKHVLTLLQDNLLMAQVNSVGKIISMGPLLSDLLGISVTEALTKTLHEITPPLLASHCNASLNAIKEGRCYEYESHIQVNKDESQELWLDALVMPLFDCRHNPQGAIIIYKDLTAQRLVERLTIIDELTGTFNRRHFNRIFKDEIQIAKKLGQWLCFLMVDVDNFKKYNDTYGHPAGDIVLKQVAQSIQHVFQRHNDYVFRLGGEEFAAVYSVKSQGEAIFLSEKARQALFDMNLPHSGNSPHYRVTFSGGLITMDPEENYITDEVYKYVDEALYQAKAHGRNTIELVHSDETELF